MHSCREQLITGGVPPAWIVYSGADRCLGNDLPVLYWPAIFGRNPHPGWRPPYAVFVRDAIRERLQWGWREWNRGGRGGLEHA